jgi:glycosyltransferase involved in cell wall biosynthesis
VSTPRVTVITPTWQRHDTLTGRCIPAVQAQDTGGVEHVIVSDGPDPDLKVLLDDPELTGWKNLRYCELPVHDEAEHWGAPARNAGLDVAAGEYITYCDDDDVLRPYHCRLLAAALDACPDAGFALSRMLSNGPYGGTVIGGTEPMCGQVGTPMIMHRRSVLEHGTWSTTGRFEDWDLVARWLGAGIRFTRVQAETCDVWPSIFR